MIISTPEELRLYLPSHVLHDLDSMQGFLDNSEADFLAERIGKPLLDALRVQYQQMLNDCNGQGYPIADRLVNISDDDPWYMLLSLCQRCIVFDAFMRAADISAVSVNDAGLNIAESNDYAQANDKTILAYKQQMSKEAHAASNRLLIQLEDWQKATVSEAPASDDTDPSFGVNPDDALRIIIGLWQQSAYYYYADGLLFNTATEFGLFIDIYNSREKFIQLLPDIRYCQEVHIEAEIGEELLLDLLTKRKAGALNPIERKAVVKLQRALSLQVESRSKLFKRAEANDEAQGNMRLALAFIRKNQASFDRAAMEKSPLFDPHLWPPKDDAPVHGASAPCHDHAVNGNHCHVHKPNPCYPEPRTTCHCDCPPQPYRSQMHITSII